MESVLLKEGREMELTVHLNGLTFLHDFIDIGVKMFVVGADVFSCRQAISLDYEALKEVKSKLNKRAKLYVLVNALVEQRYLKDLEQHLDRLHQLQIDGLLFQDFAVLQICKEKGYAFDFIYAPDTLNTNQATLTCLHEQGISGAFLAREIPLVEKQSIHQALSIPCMVQIHGVEYMAYSKRKLLDTYYDVIHRNYGTSKEDEITILANNTKEPCHIYQDQYGTHILTVNQLCGLDVLSSLVEFEYGYIESLYLSEMQLVEIVHLYMQGLQALEDGTYGKVAKELMPLLHQLNPSIEYYHGFLFDQTVYTIKDVRKREEDERNK